MGLSGCGGWVIEAEREGNLESPEVVVERRLWSSGVDDGTAWTSAAEQLLGGGGGVVVVVEDQW